MSFYATLTYAKIREGKIIRTYDLRHNGDVVAEFDTINKSLTEINWRKSASEEVRNLANAKMLEELANA